MSRWLTVSGILAGLLLIGCSQGDSAPADPSATPKVSEEDIKKSMKSAYEKMPPEAQKKYGGYIQGKNPPK